MFAKSHQSVSKMTYFIYGVDAMFPTKVIFIKATSQMCEKNQIGIYKLMNITLKKQYKMF